MYQQNSISAMMGAPKTPEEERMARALRQEQTGGNMLALSGSNTISNLGRGMANQATAGAKQAGTLAQAREQVEARQAEAATQRGFTKDENAITRTATALEDDTQRAFLLERDELKNELKKNYEGLRQLNRLEVDDNKTEASLLIKTRVSELTAKRDAILAEYRATGDERKATYAKELTGYIQEWKSSEARLGETWESEENEKNRKAKRYEFNAKQSLAENTQAFVEKKFAKTFGRDVENDIKAAAQWDKEFGLKGAKFDEFKSQYARTMVFDRDRLDEMTAQFAKTHGLDVDIFGQRVKEFDGTMVFNREKEAAVKERFDQEFGLKGLKFEEFKEQYQRTASLDDDKFNALV